jgi:LysM repeat protein
MLTEAVWFYRWHTVYQPLNEVPIRFLADTAEIYPGLDFEPFNFLGGMTEEPVTLYAIQQGDTLSSVAIRFDLTVSWLRHTNNLFTDAIFPGEELKIVPLPPDPPARVPQIDCHFYVTDKRLPDIPGKLRISGHELRFEPATQKMHRITIPLTSHVHHKLMPHPRLADRDFNSPTAPFIIAIVYVKKLTNPDSARTIFFSAHRADLVAFDGALEKFAAESKRQRRVTEVTLDDIPGPTSAPPPPPAPPPRVGGRPRAAVALQDIELSGWPSVILEMPHVLEIRRAMPKVYRNHDWALLYRLSVDGCSYQTLYRRTEKMQQVVVVAQNDDCDRFGAFVPSGLKPSKLSGFTGSGQTFVFKLDPQLEIFRWSKAPDSNNFFVAAGEKELIIGGGGGPAIYFGADFLVGRTHQCATFGSPLLARKEQFRVVEVEVWAVIGAEQQT